MRPRGFWKYAYTGAALARHHDLFSADLPDPRTPSSGGHWQPFRLVQSKRRKILPYSRATLVEQLGRTVQLGSAW
jgi:hypothetical protein